MENKTIKIKLVSDKKVDDADITGIFNKSIATVTNELERLSRIIPKAGKDGGIDKRKADAAYKRIKKIQSEILNISTDLGI